MAISSTVVELQGDVQNYAWGSATLLPELLGFEPDGHPHAELWLGAHAVLPSRLGETDPLDTAIAADPARFLGAHADGAGAVLPYLLKVLAVGSPLSIQVHPSKAQAEVGFAREDAAGIDRSAANRSYRDPNHKPEIICALTPFELLCGFVDDDTLRNRLRAFGEASLSVIKPLALRVTRSHPGAGRTVEGEREVNSQAANASYEPITLDQRRALLGAILRIPKHQATSAVDAVRRVAPSLGLGHMVAIADQYPNDPGVLVAALMNYRKLDIGEAMFFEAGVTHAYLSGLGVELLANSDNVLRAGLTPKHIDVDELLRICNPAATPAVTVDPADAGGVTVWPTPCTDFELQRVRGSAEVGSDAGPRIVLCTAGAVTLTDDATGATVHLGRGETAWVFPGVSLRLQATSLVHADSAVAEAETFIARSPMLG